MAIVVMILGESGTGKSASMRNFTADDVAVVNVIGKPFPFRNKHFETLDSDSYSEIITFLRRTDRKSIVIDDSQYLMGNEYMRRAQEKGFDKFTEMGQNFWNLINFCIRKLPADTIVYFLQHVERTDAGIIKAKTIGNLIDSKITLEGMFSIVLRTNVNDGEYTFRTQNNGQDTVKSPVGMFDSEEIPNDLKMVDTKIREYYDLETNQLMESGGFADAAAQHEKTLDLMKDTGDDIIESEEQVSSSFVDLLRRKLTEKGITEQELQKIIDQKGVYTEDVPIDEYEDDFLEYILENFNKISGAIIKARGGKK